jgi:hypothetical protein
MPPERPGVADAFEEHRAESHGHGWEVLAESLVRFRLPASWEQVAPGRGRLSGLPGAVLADERLGGQPHCAGSVGTGWRAERIHFAGLLHVAPIDTCPFTEIPPVAGAPGDASPSGRPSHADRRVAGVPGHGEGCGWRRISSRHDT